MEPSVYSKHRPLFHVNFVTESKMDKAESEGLQMHENKVCESYEDLSSLDGDEI